MNRNKNNRVDDNVFLNCRSCKSKFNHLLRICCFCYNQVNYVFSYDKYRDKNQSTLMKTNLCFFKNLLYRTLF